MKACPRSKFENEDGSMNFTGYDIAVEYPEVLAWQEEYKNECDRIASLKAATHKRHWGRWYLSTQKPICIVTVSSRPNIGKEGYRPGGDYEIELSRVGKWDIGGNGYTWLSHMAEKNWIGKQGLIDLERAFNDLIKEGLINQSL